MYSTPGNKFCLRLTSLFTLLVALWGCGLSQDYASVRPNLSIRGSGRVVVAGLDNRPYVINEDKEPSFVGLMRSGYGIPYDVHTSSDEPFAGELAKAACSGLERSGYQCRSLLLSRSGVQSQLDQALRDFGATKALVLTVRDWKTDTYNGTSLKYEIALRVSGIGGALLASSQVEGVDNLGSSWLSPASVAQEETPKKMKEKLERLLGNPRITSALAG